MCIDDLYKTMPVLEQGAMRIAFSNDLPYKYVFPDGTFLAVNLDQLSGLEVITQKGEWYYGRLVRSSTH